MRAGSTIAVACVLAVLTPTGGDARTKQKLARNMKAAPVGNPAEWFSPDDYPPDAIRSVRQGRVVVAVGVDSVGKVVSCAVEMSSGTASLDTRTCELALQRGVFNPATDRTGLPVASVYHLPVRWVLPDDGGEAPVLTAADAAKMELEIATELTVGANGKLVSCRVLTAKLPEGAKQDPCGQDQIGAQITPGWTRGERPVAAKIVRRVSQTITLDP